jgi:hypothetical protein
MSITYKAHGFHSDTNTVHTICGGFAEDRDLLMRKFISSKFLWLFVRYDLTAWIGTFMIKIATKVLLGKKCLDCERRRILAFSRKGNICFCLDNNG